MSIQSDRMIRDLERKLTALEARVLQLESKNKVEHIGLPLPQMAVAFAAPEPMKPARGTITLKGRA